MSKILHIADLFCGAGGTSTGATQAAEALGYQVHLMGVAEPYLVTYYGNGQARPVDVPLDTVTTKERFGLVEPTVTAEGKRYRLDIRFRMLQPHELAGAQGFPASYRFSGTKTDAVKQIGNAVPCGLARALVGAALAA